MLNNVIATIDALPGEATSRIAREIEAFEHVREVDPEMACVRAQRCADLIARHIYARRLGATRSLSLKELIAALLKHNLVTYDVGVALEIARSIGDVAMTTSLSDDDGGRSVTTRDVEHCKQALETLAKWLVEHGPTLIHDADVANTVVVPDMDLTLQDVLGTIDVDRDVYGQVESTYIPTPEIVTRWFYCNSDIYTILKDKASNRVVGYINAMPVSQEGFEQILSGCFNESELGFDEIQPYTRPGFYRLYFCSIAILREFRTPTNLRKLLDGFCVKWGRLAHQNIFVSEVAADAVTEEGQKLCSAFGMRRVATTDRDSNIYHIRTLPPEFPPAIPSARALRDFYGQVYARFQNRIINRK